MKEKILMLIHPIIDQLKSLRLNGMALTLEEQMQMPDIASLSFEERLGLIVDREANYRENRKLKTRLKNARLKQSACIEDIDFKHPRGLDKSLMSKLFSCNWIKDANNLIITGPTGTGKTYIACALAQKACREGYTVQYIRMPRSFHDLHIAKGDGRYGKILKDYAKTKLLIFDDWGLTKMTDESRHDLLEILEDRNSLSSTMITSQFPVDTWYNLIGDPTLADAIMDRLVHSAYKIELKGKSMRKNKSPLTKSGD
jgi:DNA replication protein DnaC